MKRDIEFIHAMNLFCKYHQFLNMPEAASEFSTWIGKERPRSQSIQRVHKWLISSAFRSSVYSLKLSWYIPVPVGDIWNDAWLRTRRDHWWAMKIISQYNFNWTWTQTLHKWIKQARPFTSRYSYWEQIIPKGYTLRQQSLLSPANHNGLKTANTMHFSNKAFFSI